MLQYKPNNWDNSCSSVNLGNASESLMQHQITNIASITSNMSMNNVEILFPCLFICFYVFGCVKQILKVNVALVVKTRVLQLLQKRFSNFFSLLLLSVCCFCTGSLQPFKS